MKKVKVLFGLVLFLLNMIIFSILNIPLFQYFCDIPYDISLFGYHSQNLCYFFYDTFNMSYHIDSIDFFFLFHNNYNHLFFHFINFYFFIFDVFNLDFISNVGSKICERLILEVRFQTATTNNLLEFLSLQNSIFVITDETHLIFCRMYNHANFYISGISIYFVYPSDYLIFFNKIQCFCFEEILLFPFETVDLPVVFYISGDICDQVELDMSNQLILSYFFISK